MDSVPDGKEDELAASAGEDLFGNIRRTPGERSSTTGKGVDYYKKNFSEVGKMGASVNHPLTETVRCPLLLIVLNGSGLVGKTASVNNPKQKRVL